jgi:plasmid stability protein
MGQVLVRNLADETIARLKARAAANGRSMEAEIREILKESLVEGAPRRSWDEFERLAAISRALTANRPAGAATAEALLRESRDER